MVISSVGCRKTWMPLLVMQEDEGTSTEHFACVSNQSPWDQLVSIDRLAMPIDVEARSREGEGDDQSEVVHFPKAVVNELAPPALAIVVRTRSI